MNTPLVTVYCTTYNHVAYIRKALDGFLIQKTKFPFEILIHDDASTDGTSEIIQEYIKMYPGIIRAVIEKENQYSQHKNYDISMLPLMRGKYVSYCEGDDYWTDSFKLQKQAEFMENHPDYSMIFHAGSYEYNGEIIFIDRISESDRDYSVEDIIRGGGAFGMLATFFVRAKYIFDYPEFRAKAPFGDYTLHILMGLKGKVRYFSDNMSTYRWMSPGSWTERYQIKDFRLNNSLEEIRMLQRLDDYTSGKYKDVINDQIDLSLSLLLREDMYSIEDVFEIISNRVR